MRFSHPHLVRPGERAAAAIDVMQQMSDTQIRRVPVVSHDEQHRLAGIAAIGDLVVKPAGGRQDDVEELVEKASSPSQPDRSESGSWNSQSVACGAQ